MYDVYYQDFIDTEAKGLTTDIICEEIENRYNVDMFDEKRVEAISKLADLCAYDRIDSVLCFLRTRAHEIIGNAQASEFKSVLVNILRNNFGNSDLIDEIMCLWHV